MRVDKQRRHKLLCDLITKAIEAEGQLAEGFLWAVKPRQAWADAVGVDIRTIAALIELEPIVRLSTAIKDGGQFKRVAALRIFQPGEMAKPLSADEAAASVAKTLAKLFKAATGKPVSPHQFGCLVGLAETWPASHQVAVFAHTLKEWGPVMAAIRVEAALQHGDPDYENKFLNYPSVSVMRRFASTVADAYLTDHQVAGKVGLPFADAAE